MHQPIEIPMEDELIHTQERPYCDDPACPCHSAQAEPILAPPPKHTRREGRRKHGASRRKRRASGSR